MAHGNQPIALAIEVQCNEVPDEMGTSMFVVGMRFQLGLLTASLILDPVSAAGLAKLIQEKAEECKTKIAKPSLVVPGPFIKPS